jgi:hypothetical protein
MELALDRARRILFVPFREDNLAGSAPLFAPKEKENRKRGREIVVQWETWESILKTTRFTWPFATVRTRISMLRRRGRTTLCTLLDVGGSCERIWNSLAVGIAGFKITASWSATTANQPRKNLT